MRTSDGGLISNAFKMVHGAAGVAEHTTFSNGMVYKDVNTLFVTFMQTSPTMRTSVQYSDYAGFFYIARIDPMTGTLVWRKEME